ncbi:MAG: hypothetical protein ACHWZW_14780 [Spirulina sp.]
MMTQFVSWISAQGGRIGLMIAMVGLVWGVPIWGTSAWAGNWLPVTPAGLEQQFIDVDSIQPQPGGTVQVRSLYLNQRQQPAQRTTYLTEYRCQDRQYRDVEYNGQPGDLTWHSVAGDPLNAQTLDYVCSQVGQESATTP